MVNLGTSFYRLRFLHHPSWSVVTCYDFVFGSENRLVHDWLRTQLVTRDWMDSSGAQREETLNGLLFRSIGSATVDSCTCVFVPPSLTVLFFRFSTVSVIKAHLVEITPYHTTSIISTSWPSDQFTIGTIASISTYHWTLLSTLSKKLRKCRTLTSLQRSSRS